jgi:uncharacterized membrane protein (DUF2068 family)
MRPRGIILIAIYHFLGAAFLVLLAITLGIGVSLLEGMSATGNSIIDRVGFIGAGFLLLLPWMDALADALAALGVIGICFSLVFAVIAALAGYGIWTFREWGRILCIVLAALSLLFSLTGLLMPGPHLGFFLGGYRLIKLAISVAIVWYLMQPQIRALFRPRATILPSV